MASPIIYYRVEKNTPAYAAQLEWEKQSAAYNAAVIAVRAELKVPKDALSYHSPYGLAGFKLAVLPDDWRRCEKTSDCCVPRRDTAAGKKNYKLIMDCKRPNDDVLKKLFFGVTGFIMDKTDVRRGGGIPMVGVGISYGRKAKNTAYITTRMVLVKCGKPLDGLTELTASQYEAAVGAEEEDAA